MTKADEYRYDYAKADWKYANHRRRWTLHVLNRRPRLLCQACGGAGGFVEPILDDGTGPFETCGYCLGVGYISAWLRGYWLREQKERTP